MLYDKINIYKNQECGEMNYNSEIEKEVLKEIDKISMKQVVHSKPLYTLEDTLLSKNITNLRKLGHIHKIIRYTKMDKNELVSSIAKEISNVEYLHELLMIIDSSSFEEFCAAAKTSQYICTGLACAKLNFLKASGIAALYYYNDNFIAVIPDEIKANFNTLVANGFINEKKRSDLIYDYASAAVNLYGIISQDDFIAIFNSQNKKKTDIDEVFQTLMPHIMIDSNYCFWEEYIVSIDFEDNDFKDINYLLNEIGDKPRFTPSKQELLKYIDGEYYEETPQTKELLRYLKSIVDDPIEAEDIADDMCLACAAESDFSDLFDIVNENSVKLKYISQTQKITELITAVSNNTRIWTNNGYTPNELFSKFTAPNLLPLKSPVNTEKIGRNSPCPCGSGKKYKRCCGK